MNNNEKVVIKISWAVKKSVIEKAILMGGQEVLDISDKTHGPVFYLPG